MRAMQSDTAPTTPEQGGETRLEGATPPGRFVDGVIDRARDNAYVCRIWGASRQPGYQEALNCDQRGPTEAAREPTSGKSTPTFPAYAARLFASLPPRVRALPGAVVLGVVTNQSHFSPFEDN